MVVVVVFCVQAVERYTHTHIYISKCMHRSVKLKLWLGGEYVSVSPRTELEML